MTINSAINNFQSSPVRTRGLALTPSNVVTRAATAAKSVVNIIINNALLGYLNGPIHGPGVNYVARISSPPPTGSGPTPPPSPPSIDNDDDEEEDTSINPDNKTKEDLEKKELEELKKKIKKDQTKQEDDERIEQEINKIKDKKEEEKIKNLRKNKQGSVLKLADKVAKDLSKILNTAIDETSNKTLIDALDNSKQSIDLDKLKDAIEQFKKANNYSEAEKSKILDGAQFIYDAHKFSQEADLSEEKIEDFSKEIQKYRQKYYKGFEFYKDIIEELNPQQNLSFRNVQNYGITIS